jgi:hypothetical protein
MRYLMLAIIGLCATVSVAQNGVQIYSTPDIEAMIAEHKKINRERGVLAGYRIQIYSSSVLRETREARDEFGLNFPEMEARIILEEPDFKLVVGQYLDRFSAQKDLQTLIADFPGAFLIKDLIDITDL